MEEPEMICQLCLNPVVILTTHPVKPFYVHFDGQYLNGRGLIACPNQTRPPILYACPMPKYTLPALLEKRK